MKKIVLFLGLFSLVQLEAQETVKVLYEGYTEVLPIAKRFEENPYKQAEYERKTREAFERPSYHILTASDKEALFLEDERIDNSQSTEKESMSVKFTAATDGYLNLDEDYSLSKRTLSDGEYWVYFDFEPCDWKISEDEKEILNHKVQYATCSREDAQIQAWYAPDLKFPFGPSDYYGLPGLILEINDITEYENGTTVKVHFIATEFLKVKAHDVAKRPKGRMIDEEMYEMKLEEAQKEFMEYKRERE